MVGLQMYQITEIIFMQILEVVTSLPPNADLRQQSPPVYDQGQPVSCLVAGTNVTTGDCSEKSIEQIEEGEFVTITSHTPC
jgi:hypothetical protein